MWEAVSWMVHPGCVQWVFLVRNKEECVQYVPMTRPVNSIVKMAIKTNCIHIKQVLARLPMQTSVNAVFIKHAAKAEL